MWLSLGEEIENAGVNGADDDGDSGGGTFSACALVVLSDKGSTSLRINFLLPFGAHVTHPVKYTFSIV